ncbi:small ubiquitin-related modifier [Nematocida sp. AWRm80]|nr:small ubiquitin-related modifier [Nematocida sp. AWRm80]
MKIEEIKQKPEEKKIQIKVLGFSGESYSFRLGKTTKIGKLFSEYSKRQGSNLSKLRFVYKGKTLQPTDTPEGLELEDGSSLEVFGTQVGG